LFVLNTLNSDAVTPACIPLTFRKFFASRTSTFLNHAERALPTRMRWLPPGPSGGGGSGTNSSLLIGVPDINCARPLSCNPHAYGRSTCTSIALYHVCTLLFPTSTFWYAGTFLERQQSSVAGLSARFAHS